MVKVVIAVAGMGTRFYPIAKTICKCMLPILDQPVLAYAVTDCVAAGATDIAIVTADGEPGRQVRHYLTEDTGLASYFAARGQPDQYQPIAHLHDQATFTFIEQPRDTRRYGTALPAILAADFIAGDDFYLIAGDDLLLRDDGGSDLADLAAARATAGTTAALAAATITGQQANRYGILHTRISLRGHHLLDDLIEKPNHYSKETAYINVSRSLLPGEALPYFQKLAPAPSGEYQATDAIAAFAQDHDTLIHPIAGHYFDCGNPAGWLAANNAAARAQCLNLTNSAQ
jgi:UTP--glucose-1-phosphate uridylyltransferase